MNNICSWLFTSLIFFSAEALLLTRTLADSDSPDLLISLVRHGERSPRVPLDENLWPMGSGEMTPDGLRKAFELGQHLRTQYFGNSLPRLWHNGNSRHLAKGMNRTIQSATAILQGFYPAGVSDTGLPQQIQLPPVYAYPLESDSLFSPHYVCPGFVKRIEALENSPDWISKKKSYGNRFHYWARLAQRSPNIYSLVPLMDSLLIRQQHNIPLPASLTRSDEQQLLELLDWFFDAMVKDYELVQLFTNHFIRELISTLKRHQSCMGEGCEQFVLYVASDNNLLTFLAAMGVPRSRNVAYSTHLDMLVKGSRSQKRLSFYLNDKPLSFPGCPERCLLSQWLGALERVLPDDWDALCAIGTGVLLKNSSLVSKLNNHPATKDE